MKSKLKIHHTCFNFHTTNSGRIKAIVLGVQFFSEDTGVFLNEQYEVLFQMLSAFRTRQVVLLLFYLIW